MGNLTRIVEAVIVCNSQVTTVCVWSYLQKTLCLICIIGYGLKGLLYVERTSVHITRKYSKNRYVGLNFV